MATPTYSRGCSVPRTHAFRTFRPHSLTSQFRRPNYLVYVNTLLSVPHTASFVQPPTDCPPGSTVLAEPHVWRGSCSLQLPRYFSSSGRVLSHIFVSL